MKVGKLAKNKEKEIADLHIWRVGRRHYACIISLVSDDPAVTRAVRSQMREEGWKPS